MARQQHASTRLILGSCLAILVCLLVPHPTQATASMGPARNASQPRGIRTDVALACLGERGATAVITVENT